MIVLNEFMFACCKDEKFNFSPVDVIQKSEVKFEKIYLPHDVALSVTGYKTAEELYYGCNVFKTQDYEDIHAFYYTSFQAQEGDYILRLNRVDVFADIYEREILRNWRMD